VIQVVSLHSHQQQSSALLYHCCCCRQQVFLFHPSWWCKVIVSQQHVVKQSPSFDDIRICQHITHTTPQSQTYQDLEWKMCDNDSLLPSLPLLLPLHPHGSPKISYSVWVSVVSSHSMVQPANPLLCILSLKAECGENDFRTTWRKTNVEIKHTW